MCEKVKMNLKTEIAVQKLAITLKIKLNFCRSAPT